MIGANIGPYVILREIGRGAAGIVYLAEHRHLHRAAAIKVLARDLSDERESLGRLFIEARASALLDHPGIVRVFDCDVHPNGRAFIVMEYVQGDTLRSYLRARGPLPPSDAASIARYLAEALGVAHDKQIVHRDLKPDNIFVLDGAPFPVKVVDFGIAKLTDPDRRSSTMSGAILGTPLYMSPEQARGASEVDHRADIYSLGCILYEMVSGRPPFQYQGLGELISAHMSETPPAPDSLGVAIPADLSDLILAMLSKAPADRPPSMAVVARSLERFAGGRNAGTAVLSPAPTTTIGHTHGESMSVPPGRRRWAVASGLFAAAAAAVVLVRSSPPRPKSPRPIATEPSPAPAPPPPIDPPAPASVAASPVVPRSPPPVEEGAHRRPTHLRAEGRPNIRVSLSTSPPGATVCLADSDRRLGTTNGTFQLRRERRPRRLILYLPGYHSETVVLAGDRDVTLDVPLRALTADDLREPPPCR